jgi:hypothetical protein
MAPIPKAPNDISIDWKKEAGGTVYVKKDGVATEGDWSVLKGKTVGENGNTP